MQKRQRIRRHCVDGACVVEAIDDSTVSTFFTRNVSGVLSRFCSAEKFGLRSPNSALRGAARHIHGVVLTPCHGFFLRGHVK